MKFGVSAASLRVVNISVSTTPLRTILS